MTMVSDADRTHAHPDGAGLRADDRVVQLVVRAAYPELVGRPADEVHRVLRSRLDAAGVQPADDTVREIADAVSDGSFLLLR
jgi:hypothetical protein